MKQVFGVVTFVIGLMFLSFCFKGFSQNDSIYSFKVSVSAGFGISQLSNVLTPIRPETESLVKYGKSFMIGSGISFKLSKKVNTDFAIFYNQINSKWGFYVYNSGALNTIDETFFKIHCLSLPLIFTYSIKKVQLGVGLQYSSLISSHVDARIAYPAVSYDTTRTLEGDIFLKSDLSASGYIAYPIYKQLYIEGRFNQGIIEVTDYEGGFVSESKTRQFLIGLKYYIK